MQKPYQPRCSFCQNAVVPGDFYWYCNGATICTDCISDYAQGALISYRHRYEQEESYDT